MSAEQKLVLIVDDEAPNRKLLEQLLPLEGYQVISAADGVEALNAVETQRPDMILLDVMMPELDGFEVAKKLKANKDTAGIPIIMLTALNDQSSKIKGLAAGAEDFLSKPFDRTELSIRLRNLIRLADNN